MEAHPGKLVLFKHLMGLLIQVLMRALMAAVNALCDQCCSSLQLKPQHL